jgi:hypothetical protein
MSASNAKGPVHRDEPTSPAVAVRTVRIDDLVAWLRAGEPFSLSRWGDGEWSSVLGRTTGSNADGQAYEAALGASLRALLRARPPYQLALRTWQEIFDGSVEQWIENEDLAALDWTTPDVLHRASAHGQLEPFMQAIRDAPAFLAVGPSHLRDARGALGFSAFVRVPAANAYAALPELREAVIAAAGRLPQGAVVTVSAGMTGKLLVDDLYRHFGQRLTLLDVGSLWDPFAGVLSRRYMRNPRFAHHLAAQQLAIAGSALSTSHERGALHAIDWSLYDFITIGCSNKGGAIGYSRGRFAARRGLGIDVHPGKVEEAQAAGYDAVIADAREIPADADVRFVSMLDVLARMPDLDYVEQVIATARDAATDFLFIRHASFEGEAYLATLGLRQYWWHWSVHTAHLRISDYCQVFERLGLRQYFIRYREPVLNSAHPTILTADSPINQGRFDPALHREKPEITFSEPIWRAQDIFVALRAFAPDEWHSIVGDS